MGKTRVTLYICDNPKCAARHQHTTADPAPGFHLTGARYFLPDGGWRIGKLYACKAECLANAIEAAAKRAVLAAPAGEEA